MSVITEQQFLETLGQKLVSFTKGKDLYKKYPRFPGGMIATL